MAHLRRVAGKAYANCSRSSRQNRIYLETSSRTARRISPVAARPHEACTPLYPPPRSGRLDPVQAIFAVCVPQTATRDPAPRPQIGKRIVHLPGISPPSLLPSPPLFSLFPTLPGLPLYSPLSFLQTSLYIPLSLLPCPPFPFYPSSPSSLLFLVSLSILLFRSSKPLCISLFLSFPALPSRSTPALPLPYSSWSPSLFSSFVPPNLSVYPSFSPSLP